jgi:hypothetical protein
LIRLRGNAVDAIVALRARIDAVTARVQLPDLPAVPQAVLDADRELPPLLIDSGEDFRVQCDKLIASRHTANSERPGPELSPPAQPSPRSASWVSTVSRSSAF